MPTKRKTATERHAQRVDDARKILRVFAAIDTAVKIAIECGIPRQQFFGVIRSTWTKIEKEKSM